MKRKLLVNEYLRISQLNKFKLNIELKLLTSTVITY